MLADAQQTRLRAEPLTLAQIKPCRCCGEAEHLDIDPMGAEMQFLFDADLNIIRDAKGEPVDFTDAYVWCRVCDMAGPAFFWNADPEAAAIARRVTLAAWEEYSEDGTWIGARQ